MFSSLDGLNVVDCVIRTRGEFYAEKWYVPHFAKRVKSRHFNYTERGPDGRLWHICIVTDEEKKAFPDLVNVATVGVSWEGNKCNSWVRSCSYQKRP